MRNDWRFSNDNAGSETLERKDKTMLFAHWIEQEGIRTRGFVLSAENRRAPVGPQQMHPFGLADH